MNFKKIIQTFVITAIIALGFGTIAPTAQAVSISVIFFLVATFIVHYPFVRAFIFALGMIVAFIPEGLLPKNTGSLRLCRRWARLSQPPVMASTTLLL